MYLICHYSKVCYFYVGKKYYSISITNYNCFARKYFSFKTTILLSKQNFSITD